MCDENQYETLNKSFADNDEVNWYTNTTNPIQTIDSKLLLRPSAKNSLFGRNIGELTPDRNKLRIKLNLEVFRPIQNGSREISYFFQVFIGGTMVAQYNLTDKALQPGETAKYYLDKIIDLPTLAGMVILKIVTPIGFDNNISLRNLAAVQYNFCTDNVRTYFVLDGLLEESFQSVSTAILFNSFKIDNLETLTVDFRDYNSKKCGNNPLALWYFANADPDGTNRLDGFVDSNSFNPFVKEFGLLYDAPSNYAGLPTGTINGKNFGSGVMKIGFDKPIVLNADAVAKKGAFFIDLDYSKSFFLSFDIAINNLSDNAFSNPDSYRNYIVAWDFEKKKKSFYYNDLQNNTQSNQLKNGFLTGQTGVVKSTAEIPVGLGVAFGSNDTPYSLIANLETGEKITGIEYEIDSVPIKIDIEFKDERYSTGYVGNSSYNQKLLNAGVPANEIKTVGSDNFNGQLKFNKLVGDPDFFKVTITAPLQDAKGSFTEISKPYVEIFLGVGLCADVVNYDKRAYVYVANLNSFDIVDAMQLFSVGSLDVNFDGGDQNYKAYIYDRNGRRDMSKTFKVSPSGVVSDIIIC